MPRVWNSTNALFLATLLGLAAGCSSSSAPNADTLKLGAYSVVREALHDGVLPAFAAHWKKKTGRDVQFEESYNASGAQARAIAAGFDADIAILSHSGDMDLLVNSGKVNDTWDDADHKGIITRSIVVIGVRPGNPKGISDWADLAKPGIGVLYPDPKTSGGARWNINAIYGAAFLEAKKAAGDSEPDIEPVKKLLAGVQANVVNMDPSGRQSMANFERGTGDVVVTYENELLLRRREGLEIPYVVPPATLVIEGPAALVESSIKQHGNREVAEAFLEFLRTPEAQSILADYGFRPTTEGVDKEVGAPLPEKAFTIADLGGWSEVEKTLYGPDGHWTTIFSAGTSGR